MRCRAPALGRGYGSREVSSIPELPEGMCVEAWRAGALAQPLADWRDAGREGQGIIWIDLDNVAQWDAVAEALEAMELPMFERSMLGHVLQRVGPEQHGAEDVPWYDHDVARQLNRPGAPSYLDAFGLKADIAPGHDGPPWVFIQPVAFLVSSRWIITHRVNGSASDGHKRTTCEPFPLERLRRYAAAEWRRYANPEDLAILILRSLTESYRPALADVDVRLEVLQQAYVQGREPNSIEGLDEAGYRSALLQVKWVIDTISQAVVRLSRPATSIRTAWFRIGQNEAAAHEVAELLERAERTLTRQREEVRESFALAAASQTSEQLTLARQSQELAAEADERARRFETMLQFAAAALLVPALVAQVLGALPAVFEDCPGLRAFFVIGVTTASGVLSVLGLVAYRRRANR
jgi:hypothetical protein